jgi:hypothetical protein
VPCGAQLSCTARLRYGLSYRDVEELLAERGVRVDHMTIYRWGWGTRRLMFRLPSSLLSLACLRGGHGHGHGQGDGGRVASSTCGASPDTTTFPRASVAGDRRGAIGRTAWIKLAPDGPGQFRFEASVLHGAPPLVALAAPAADSASSTG